MSQADRERVLELLLSQQRVVQLLYEKTFPEFPDRKEGEGGEGVVNAPEEYKWIEDQDAAEEQKR